ncbi:CBS domain-containing protein [Desulfobacula sp.]|uniref:CBS domain-containing protein n=1 Tax=Desulfobacula sp. TaxID=2593537 RepID=UPI002618261F|nr:CBS domain-containing protein [Desulfobacula sp.]
MRNILIKDIMTSISDYATIKEDQTLYDVFQILETGKTSSKPVHQDLIVVNDTGEFKGKVTMIDIFRSLEPNYKKLNINYTNGTLTKDYVLKAIKDFDLWLEPVKTLCERGSGIKISELMHIPESYEYVQETDSLEKALHEYVMGVHQPLIVKKEDQVTGMLRFEDLYKVVRDHILACSI